ncbi:MAG: hypothetical protein Q4C34_04915 [Bacteroidales bacterium]|nr:hypothetical protein [Bacteroidales bacterium]
MQLPKTNEQRELELLRKVEERIERNERRERLHRILIIGLGVLAVASFVGGHVSGRYCHK